MACTFIAGLVNIGELVELWLGETQTAWQTQKKKSTFKEKVTKKGFLKDNAQVIMCGVLVRSVVLPSRNTCKQQ